MRPRAALAFGCALVCAQIGAVSAAAATAGRRVPFVGCPADGLQGPQPAAPTPDRPRPRLPAPIARRLAYYGTAEIGVLAPRGWHCFGFTGSNGSTLIVSATPHDARTLDQNRGVRGPAVQLSYNQGSTSGRFEVAAVAARIFPSSKAYIDKVEKDALLSKPFPRTPFPADRLTRLSKNRLRYVTPAGKAGLGTWNWLRPDGDPVRGIQILLPKDMDLVSLAVRLPCGQRALSEPIIRQIDRSTRQHAGL